VLCCDRAANGSGNVEHLDSALMLARSLAATRAGSWSLSIQDNRKGTFLSLWFSVPRRGERLFLP